MKLRRIVIVLAWCWAALWLLAGHSPAQPATNALQFRRVFVPVDRLEEVTSGYIPVKNEVFQQLLATLGSVSKNPGATNVRLVEATYSARLEQSDLVAGEAQLRIAHDNQESAILPLAPCSLALGTASWKSSGDAAARLGTDASGKPAVVVEPVAAGARKQQESELHCVWTQRGARDPSGSLVFDLQIPSCPAARMTLDLPDNLTPVVTQGLVTKGARNEDDPKRQFWMIEIGGRRQTTLTIISDETLRRRQRYVLQRESIAYEVTAEALQATFLQRLDIYQEPLRQLAFQLDPSLRVTAVTLEDVALPWNLTPADEGPQQRLVVEFPEVVTGQGRRLKIEALAPTSLRERWTLPRIHAQDVIWQEGIVDLRVSSALDLCELVPQDAQQTAGESAVRSGSASFQLLAPQGSIAIYLRARGPRVACDEGLTLKWDGPHLTGKLVNNVSALQGEIFELRGELSQGWLVDSVETVPADALDDWSVVATDDDNAQLAVRLAKAVKVDMPVQVTIIGHRRAPARNERLQPREYRFVDWQQITRQRRLVAVQTESQQQLAVIGDLGLERIDSRKLSETDRGLVDTNLSRLIFIDKSAAPGFFLALREETPRFSAETTTRLRLSRESVSETHTVRVAPDATPISRVVVRFSTILPGPLQWVVDGEGTNNFTARQLAADDSELWELTFLRPHANPFSVVAERQTTLRVGDPPRSLPLLAVNDAETQQGEVVVEASEGAQPLVRQQGLTPAMVGDEEVAARFRYQYSPEQKLAIQHVDPQGRAVGAWMWRHHLVARVDALGTVVYTSNYQIENAGEPQLALQLPEGATLRQLKVNGVRMPLTTTATRELLVPLPEDERYPTLQVEYAIASAPPAMWQRLALDAPVVSVPVLEEETELWLSPELKLADRNDRHNWRERLFGQLARANELPAPSLFSMAAWQPAFIARQATPQESRQALDFLAGLRQAMQAIPKDTTPTWGVWLQQHAELIDAGVLTGPGLQIEAAAFAKAGIYDNTLLPDAAERDSARLLADFGAVILLQDGTAYLTTRHALIDDSQLATFGDVGVIAISRGDETQRHDFISLAAWLADPPSVRMPWAIESRTNVKDLEAAGWNHYHLPPLSEGQVIAIYRWKDIAGVAWGVLLIAVGGTSWLVRRQLRIYLIVVVVAAIVALWLPTHLAPLATASFLGTLLGGLSGMLFRRNRRVARVAVPAAPSPSKHSVAVATLLVVSLALLRQHSLAQETAPARAPEAFRVLIPIDEQQQPTGDYLYLPKEFYDELVRQANNAKAIPQGWIVYEAVYRGRLQTSTPGQLQFAELVASYDLEVFQAGTRVTIGLGREHVHLLDNRVSLEGAPLTVDWLESGEGFTFPVEKAGRYRLEVALRPTATIDGAREQIDLRIPTLSRSLLQLRAPREAVGVQVAGARGHSLQDEPGSWRVDLGPAPRLTVYWPSGEGQDAPKNDVEATQLLWWKVEPGSVVLESQWKFSSTSQPLGEVRLIADPRLKLLPFADDQPVAEQSIREGDVQAIQLTLKDPERRELTLRARFAFTDSSGVGQLVLPRLEAVAVRTARPWLAITTSDTLEATLAQNAMTEVVAPQDFAGAWGELELPTAAYRLPENATGLSLNVRPRAAVVIARQALTYALDAAGTRAELEALVQVSHGPIFQHRLQLPDNWTITSATLHEGDVGWPVRVAIGSNGHHTLFLPHAATQEHRLLITATGPAVHRKLWTLPEVRLVSSDNEPPLVFIERAHQIAVTLEAHPGYEIVADSSAAPTDILWRRVVVLRPQPGTANRQIQIHVNRQTTTLRARQVTMLLRQNDAWQVVLDMQGEISGGDVETMRWELPAELAGVRFSLPAKLQTTSIPGQARQHLVASLEEPLRGKFTAQLIVPLSGLAAERLQIPEMRLLDTEVTETFVALPTDFEGQQLTWEARSLQPAALPRDEYPEIPANALTMIAPSGRFQVAVKRLERLAGVPQVRLADILLSIVSPTKAFGVVSLDLEPAGLSACTLHLPAGQSVVHVAVNGVPAVASPTETANEYRIALQHEQLPQHLEVTFIADMTPSRATTTLESPTLQGIPLERSLWTIRALDGMQVSQQEDAPEVFADRQAAFRIRNAATLLEQAASQAGDGESDEAAAWFAHWCRRNVQLQALFARQHADDEAAVSVASELQLLASEAQTLGQQWGASATITTALRDATRAVSQFDICMAKLPTHQRVVRAMLPGSLASVQIQLHPRSPAYNISRMIATLVVIGLFCLAVAFARSIFVRDALVRSPQIAGVMLGVLWWFFLTPAGAGLLIALAFACASLRWPWSRLPELGRRPLHTLTNAFRSR